MDECTKSLQEKHHDGRHLLQVPRGSYLHAKVSRDAFLEDRIVTVWDISPSSAVCRLVNQEARLVYIASSNRLVLASLAYTAEDGRMSDTGTAFKKNITKESLALN
ncbi:hypothetical protein O3M35_010759 [Rhynocoris fuscipes]|uniref:Uncharacterized protein n=1 Tax=Rhynocoris fuscipes TaxID=488301 RepID=A0AAW1D2J5_9HEMI